MSALARLVCGPASKPKRVIRCTNTCCTDGYRVFVADGASGSGQGVYYWNPGASSWTQWISTGSFDGIYYAADRLIGKTKTHVHGLDVWVKHDRDESDRHAPAVLAPVPDLGCSPGIEPYSFALARYYQPDLCYSPPFGVDCHGMPLVRT